MIHPAGAQYNRRGLAVTAGRLRKANGPCAAAPRFLLLTLESASCPIRLGSLHTRAAANPGRISLAYHLPHIPTALHLRSSSRITLTTSSSQYTPCGYKPGKTSPSSQNNAARRHIRPIFQSRAAAHLVVYYLHILPTWRNFPLLT